MKPLRPFFKHYGAKYRLSAKLPPPRYKHIIEPFAGSACYSLRYGWRREVTLCEIDPQTAAIWRWLISATPSDVLTLPGSLEEIQDVRVIDAPEPAKWLIQRWLTMQGSRTNYKAPPSVVKFQASPGKEAIAWGVPIRRRIAEQVQHIRHWRIVEGQWEDVCGPEATYIFDPPYQKNDYSTSNVTYGDGAKLPDFAKIGHAARSLPGQVIVHEQAGADWLPFWTLEQNALTGARNSTTMRRHEVVWMSDGQPQ